MISDRTAVRLRAALDEWFVVVVVALLALTLVGGWAVYGSMAATETDADRESVETWSTAGGFDHGVIVQAENEVFPVGTELTDRPTYFTEISPELEATFRYWYDAPDGDGDVDLEVVAEREIRSVDDDGVEYWAVNETLAESGESGLAPGEEHATDVSLDVPTTMNETDEIEDSLGGSAGETETVVAVTVTMSGTVDGEPVDRVETYELEVVADGSTYAVDGPSPNEAVTMDTAAAEDDEEVTTADSSGFLETYGAALLALASVCALGVLAIARTNGTLAPSAAELERVRTQYEREEFDDWISSGSLPDEIRGRSRIDVSTLEDLVDVAIDCDRRVLEDERAGEYYVVDGESLYVYEPDGVKAANEPPGDETTGSTDLDSVRTDEETVLGDDSSAGEFEHGDGSSSLES
ncbi:hypothetical protein GS429_01860 [Natronorubrum sp. JWXQ-INN-674]|uniref:DUF5305 domain-containing protein n=1 Tax=Natronorubrum halalkaliphilum TaxID=2691917 RepID=A0A6B0VIF1_9EURY|nr:DUF5305 domain-containing protein [Natronorubrum halalkaliphilum]MXV60835.1 hypothetical protein [Natronorubrum halalkaliphilum]